PPKPPPPGLPAQAFIRLRNESDTELQNVLFQRNECGNVSAGTLTDYQAAAVFSLSDQITLLPGDRPPLEISARVPGEDHRIRCIPVDFGGRLVSQPGWHTFGISIHRDAQGRPMHLDIVPEAQ